jgi:ferrous iron transport protein A
VYLIDASFGKTVRIAAFEGGRRLEAKLRQIGLMPGDTITVVRAAPLGGPLLLDVQGRLVAIGRGVASRVVVEEIECVSH